MSKKAKAVTVDDVATEINHRIAACRRDAKNAGRDGSTEAQRVSERVAEELERIAYWIEMRKKRR